MNEDIRKKAENIETAVKTEFEKEKEKIATEFEAMKVEIEAWWHEYVHNSPASQNTGIYNHLVQAKEKLLERIKSLFN